MSEHPQSSLGMELEALLQAASCAQESPGLIQANFGTTSVQAEIIDVDRLGVVVERIKVQTTGRNIEKQAARVAQAVRPAGQRLRAIEVDANLGGGVLRTTADHMMGGRFYQVDIDQEGAELTRHKRQDNGRRVQERFTLTREHLGQLVDELSAALGD